MKTASMIVLLLLPVLLSGVQVGEGAVLINNTSSFNVSVYDRNTTVIIDTLGPNQVTYFPMDTAGPDVYEVTRYDTSTPVTFSLLIFDNYELRLRGKRKLSSKLINRVLITPPKVEPPPNSAGGSSGG